ncbi:MAG: aryldialkylphosphatase [Dictyoglomus sp. NZ13-RE01]|nr:MAG: aryldialkylphosphatase [Dictyoglomus sp. NZ13-RE01]
MIMTVRGKIEDDDLGKTLIHEHILVDFRGAEFSKDKGYFIDEVVEIVLPYLLEIKELGYKTFVDCTPAYIGRDPELLLKLSNMSGLNIITNTGFYCAGNDKYIPRFAYDMTEKEISNIWIEEWKNGINGSVRPGFIKIGVDPGPLREIEKKIVKSACLTYHETGLTIACHTGEAQCALEVLSIIKDYDVPTSSLIIVHADGIEKEVIWNLAEEGCFIEFDSVGGRPLEYHVDLIRKAVEKGVEDRLLISHDAGWYNVGEKDGGKERFRPYTTIEKELIPELEKYFSKALSQKLLIDNPKRALSIKKQ